MDKSLVFTKKSSLQTAIKAALFKHSGSVSMGIESIEDIWKGKKKKKKIVGSEMKEDSFKIDQAAV